MNWSYTGVDGSFWRLAGDGEGRDGILVPGGGIGGLIADVQVHTEHGATGTGVRVVGMDVEPMEGSLAYLVGPDFVPQGMRGGEEPTDVDALFRRWRRAWSLNPARHGTLTAHPPSGSPLSTPVRATSVSVPEESPDSPVGSWPAGEVEVVSDLGVWLGQREELEPDRPWINGGDLHVWPTVEWTGSGRTLTVPGLSAPIPLPDAGGLTLRLDTDPATGCLVTDIATGLPALAQWRQMRGARPPYPIDVGGTSDGWSVSHDSAIYAQPRVLDPWAW